MRRRNWRLSTGLLLAAVCFAQAGTTPAPLTWQQTEQKFRANNPTLLAGQQTIEEGKRAAIYRQANDMIHDQAPAIPLVHSIVSFAAKDTIEGIVPRPDSVLDFELMRPARAGS